MEQIVFATANSHKAKEIGKILEDLYQVKTLKDIGCDEDIPETGPTISSNAILKAKYVYENYHFNCFADDTGLEIEALGGEPGVYSARYAGPSKIDEDNVQKVLLKMEGISNRNARFITVIALIIDGNEYTFEGIVEGEILTETKGTNGFGYDPIFKPNGYDLTYAQMDLETKNKMSHRAIATRKLIDFLKNY